MLVDRLRRTVVELAQAVGAQDLFGRMQLGGAFIGRSPGMGRVTESEEERPVPRRTCRENRDWTTRGCRPPPVPHPRNTAGPPPSPSVGPFHGPRHTEAYIIGAISWRVKRPLGVTHDARLMGICRTAKDMRFFVIKGVWIDHERIFQFVVPRGRVSAPLPHVSQHVV